MILRQKILSSRPVYIPITAHILWSWGFKVIIGPHTRLRIVNLSETKSLFTPASVGSLNPLSTSFGLETARAALGAATVALIMFQGPKGDGVVNSLNEGRVFGSAAKAKSAVDYATYALIGGFIAMSAVLAASG